MQVLMKNFFSTETAVVEVTFVPSVSGNNLCSTRQPQGIYCNLDGHCIGLFVLRGKLFLYLDGGASEVCEQAVTASLHHDRLHCRLKLALDGSITTVVYAPHSSVSTQFYSEDEEDADFGLWLTNVLNSELRRTTFVDSWRSGIVP